MEPTWRECHARNFTTKENDCQFPVLRGRHARPRGGRRGRSSPALLPGIHACCALAGMVVGAVTVLVWQHFQWFKLYEIVPGFALSAITIIVISLLDKAPSATMQAKHREVEAEIAAHGE